MIKIGSHVGMSGKEMFLGSVKEALSYGANTFMVYTGAPQNTRRKEISELRVEEGLALMKERFISLRWNFWRKSLKEQRRWEVRLWCFIRVRMWEKA